MAEPLPQSEGDFTPPGGKNGITDLINNSSNTGKEVSQTIASETLSRGLKVAGQAAGRGALGKAAGGAGALVQPAVWVMSGKAPQPGDIQLWGLSTLVSLIAGAAGSGATIVTGIAKAGLEDDEDRLIQAAAAKEPEQYRPFIVSVRWYGSGGRPLVAQTIASHGGVAWRVGPSTWAYITDAQQRLVCDFAPSHAYEIYGPVLPLRIGGRDSAGLLFQWSSRPGNLIG